jgi:hypothetical protein
MNSFLPNIQKEMFRSVLSDSSFLVPNWFGPSTWVQHAPFMGYLVENLKPVRAVELGSHFGYSFFVMCQVVKAYNLGTKCFAVDTWEGDEHAGFYSSDVYNHVSRHCADNYAEFAHLLRMRFDEALSRFDDHSIDLLHIDGRHFYDDVKEDYLTWLPKLSDRAIVLFHDTQVRGRGFGVHQLWAELSSRYPSFEFFHGHGLGVLAVGPDLVPELRGLFEATNMSRVADAIRTTYATLGERLEEPARRERKRMKGTRLQRLRRKLSRLF